MLNSEFFLHENQICKINDSGEISTRVYSLQEPLNIAVSSSHVLVLFQDSSIIAYSLDLLTTNLSFISSYNVFALNSCILVFLCSGIVDVHNLDLSFKTSFDFSKFTATCVVESIDSLLIGTSCGKLISNSGEIVFSINQPIFKLLKIDLDTFLIVGTQGMLIKRSFESIRSFNIFTPIEQIQIHNSELLVISNGSLNSYNLGNPSSESFNIIASNCTSFSILNNTLLYTNFFGELIIHKESVTQRRDIYSLENWISLARSLQSVSNSISKEIQCMNNSLIQSEIVTSLLLKYKESLKSNKQMIAISTSPIFGPLKTRFTITRFKISESLRKLSKDIKFNVIISVFYPSHVTSHSFPINDKWEYTIPITDPIVKIETSFLLIDPYRKFI